MDMTDDLKRLIEENSQVIRQNIREDEESRTCWCCKKRMAARYTYTVPMYGNVYADANRREIQMVRGLLALRHKGNDLYGNHLFNFDVNSVLRAECPNLGRTRFETIQIKVPCCHECISSLTWGKVKNWPPIAMLVQQGFKLGKKPDDYDSFEAWGIAEYANGLSKHYVSDNEKADGSRERVYSGSESSSGDLTGCLVPIIVAIAATLAGCAAVFH